jgi:hypothetical protein
MLGLEAHEDQDGAIEAEATDELGQLTDTEIYEGELEAGVNDDLPTDPDRLESLTSRELRTGETDDPNVAAEEGLAYVPPSDPPVTISADDPQGAQVAAGTGASSIEEPYDADHHSDFLPGEDEMSARVREAIRADAATTAYADRIDIDTQGGMVILRGRVDDLEDSDTLAAVASVVEGVSEVRDETEVEGL